MSPTSINYTIHDLFSYVCIIDYTPKTHFIPIFPKINHQPKKWIEELSWAMAQGKGKGHRATLLKTALTETV